MSIEMLESHETLAYYLHLEKRLDEEKDPVEVVNVVAEALRLIAFRKEGRQQVEAGMHLRDSLERILAHVREVFGKVFLPREFAMHMPSARANLQQRAERYAEYLQTFRSTPSATTQQRRAARDVGYEDSPLSVRVPAGTEEEIQDPAAFAAWQEQTEAWLQEEIDKCHRLLQLLEERASAQGAK